MNLVSRIARLERQWLAGPDPDRWHGMQERLQRIWKDRKADELAVEVAYAQLAGESHQELVAKLNARMLAPEAASNTTALKTTKSRRDKPRKPIRRARAR